MAIWICAILLGAIAGFLTPLLWFILQNLEILSSSYPNFIWPLVAASVACALVAATRTFRSADGFTYLISDIHFQDGKRKTRFSLVHSLANFCVLAGKGVVGIEGIFIELLSVLGSFLGQKAKLSATQMRTLAACGITASIAAVLGQPLVAVLFVVELLYGTISYSIGVHALCAFVASGVALTVTAPDAWLGSVSSNDNGLSNALWTVTQSLDLKSAALSLLLIPVIGIVAAALVWLYRKTDAELYGLFGLAKKRDLRFSDLVVRVGIWAVLTSVTLSLFPQVLSRDFVADSFSQIYPWPVLLLAVFLMSTLGAFSYAAFGSMGLLTPVLLIGALAGNVLSLVLEKVQMVGEFGSLALLCMSGLFAAAFGAPVTATALAFGYTANSLSDNAILLFTSMLINFGAHFVCGKIQKERLSTIGLYRHGIRFRSGMCFNTLSLIQVKDAMITYVDPIPANLSLGDAFQKLMASKFSTLPVVGEKGEVKGTVSLADFYGLDSWRKLGDKTQIHSLLGLEEMIKPARISLLPEMNLETALRKMGDEDVSLVVNDKSEYCGLLVRTDLVNLYNKEVVKKAFH